MLRIPVSFSYLPKIGSQCTTAMQSFDILLLVLTLAQQRDLQVLTLGVTPNEMAQADCPTVKITVKCHLQQRTM